MESKTNKNIFYGTDKTDTFAYLEFGAIQINAGEKTVWDFRVHDEAYNWFMFSRYANDLLTYIEMSEAIHTERVENIFNIFKQNIHHPDDAALNLNKLVGLAVCHKTGEGLSYYELGQTIFGCIDAMEFLFKFLKYNEIRFPDIDLSQVNWYGLDISEMFNKFSKIMHQNYKVHTMFQHQYLPEMVDVFYSRGISLLYAIRDIDSIFHTINKSRCAIFDYSLTMSEEEEVTIGTGKSVRYLNYLDFLEALRRQDSKSMFVYTGKSKYIPDTNRLWIECLYGEEDICNDFIEMDLKIRDQLSSKLSSVPGYSHFMDEQCDIKSAWVSIEEFIETTKNYERIISC